AADRGKAAVGEAEEATAVGAEPQDTRGVLVDRPDEEVGQSLRRAVAREAAVLEERQTAVGSDPEAALAVLVDEPNAVTGEAVARAIEDEAPAYPAGDTPAVGADPERAVTVAADRAHRRGGQPVAGGEGPEEAAAVEMKALVR